MLKAASNLPVFNISNFEDYNNCMGFDKTFYVRKFRDHINDNHFIDNPHGHDFYLMLLVTRGEGTHTIDFKEYNVEPGAMFILSPGQVHHWHLSPDVDGYVLFFTREYFLLDFDHDKLVRLPFFKSTFSIPYLKLNQIEQQEVEALYSQIHDEYKSHRLNYHVMIRLYLNVMFIELSRVYKEKHKENIGYNYELIQFNRFESLIDKHFQEHQPISFYADRMSISLKQLSYLCKKTVGKTPSEMLMERIILEAKRLVIHSDMSIRSISEALNYNDNSYFIRIFKKVCNQTPEQFRYSFGNRTRELEVFHQNKNTF